MALINCSKCGARVSDKATCCPKCGCDLASANTSTPAPESANDATRIVPPSIETPPVQPPYQTPQPEYQPEYQPTPQKSSSGLKWLLVILLLIILGGGGFVWWHFDNDKSAHDAHNEDMAAMRDSIERIRARADAARDSQMARERELEALKAEKATEDATNGMARINARVGNNAVVFVLPKDGHQYDIKGNVCFGYYYYVKMGEKAKLWLSWADTYTMCEYNEAGQYAGTFHFHQDFINEDQTSYTEYVRVDGKKSLLYFDPDPSALEICRPSEFD